MNKDQVKGRAKEAMGKAKEVTGKVVGNKKMEHNGTSEKNQGRSAASLADLKDDFKKNRSQ